MIGTLINVAAILLGTLIGCLLRKGIRANWNQTIMQGLGLCVLMIGITGVIKTQDAMGMIVAVIMGGFLGAVVNIEGRLDKLGQRAQKMLAGKGGAGESTVGKAFVTASLIYCVGAMAIVGAMDSGLRGDHSTLIAKSALDGVMSIILASTMGPGVALAALAVLIYQGAIALLAQWVAPLMTDAVVREMSATGGLLIIGIGLNILYDKHIYVGNLLPAIFVPIAYIPLMTLFT